MNSADKDEAARLRDALLRLVNSIEGRGPNGGKWDTRRALRHAHAVLEEGQK